jgi:hypothetical protein
MEERGYIYKFLVVKPEGKGDIGVDGRMLLKWILKE